jgi:DNA-binding transcriptional LysR family regulator
MQRPAPRELHVSVTPTLGIRWLGPRITRFQTLHPDITVRIAFGLHLADSERG